MSNEAKGGNVEEIGGPPLDATLPARLADRLKRPLPGPMVGSRFEPTPRSGRHYDRFPAHAREAAVLVLLYPCAGQWHVPLTLRPATLPTHAGQISLPGGAVEAGEASSEAALREFREEVGGHPERFALLGTLSSLYVAASNYRVTPWVAAVEETPAWQPNPHEVAAVLEVPLAHLLDPAHFGSVIREYRGERFSAPHFEWRSHHIWGATCMILGELVTVLADL